MSYSRKFTDLIPNLNQVIDAPLLYQYLIMNVEDAEYPTAVPVAAAAVLIGSLMVGAKAVTGIYGLFSSGDHYHREHKRAFLSIDGVDDHYEFRQ